ncbi:DgyrCDS12624 [Dimorphilus gyrociliatus]|uniref:DgyrCDS12624 n=1 Tax=Dimorphilus gyrociliatus TaxID=2664684 RepID=A0A7I8W7R5_9ANNE|nr:DgyrCDS12624 [Dimorphilus gyrociliatus]
MEKEVYMIGDKSITELRVVDLKKELELRKLSKSGSKIELVKRLKNYMRNQRSQSDTSENENQTSKATDSGDGPNDFVKQYLEKQQRTYEQMCHEKEKIEDKPTLRSTKSQPANKDKIADGSISFLIVLKFIYIYPICTINLPLNEKEADKQPSENSDLAVESNVKPVLESKASKIDNTASNQEDESSSPASNEDDPKDDLKDKEIVKEKQVDDEPKKSDNCSVEGSESEGSSSKDNMEEDKKREKDPTEERLISKSSQAKDTPEDFLPSSPSKSPSNDQAKDDVISNSNQSEHTNEESKPEYLSEDQIDNDEISMEVNSDGLELKKSEKNHTEKNIINESREVQPTKRKLISPPSTEINEKKRVITTTRQASKIDLDDSLRPVREKSASPARQQPSRVILVRNLVRPFTIGQLKSVLNRNNPIINDLFWIDNIKSFCYAVYETEEAASDMRNFLDNSKWPSSNPKLLKVDFSSEQEVYNHLVADKPDAIKLLKIDESKLEKPKRRDNRQVERERRVSDRDARDSLRDEKREKNREVDRSRRDHVREWDREKIRRSPQRDEGRSRSPRRREREERYEKIHQNAPAKLLDDLFHKTQAVPAIYWLPLTDEGAQLRDETRKKEKESREQRRREREEEEKQKRRKELYESEPKQRYEELSRRRRNNSNSD